LDVEVRDLKCWRESEQWHVFRDVTKCKRRKLKSSKSRTKYPFTQILLSTNLRKALWGGNRDQWLKSSVCVTLQSIRATHFEHQLLTANHIFTTNHHKIRRTDSANK
jgi:hypothetical protein